MIIKALRSVQMKCKSVDIKRHAISTQTTKETVDKDESKHFGCYIWTYVSESLFG